jgi:hypothetical protein
LKWFSFIRFETGRWEEQERQQGVVCVFLQISVEIASGFGINSNTGSRFYVQMVVMRYCICHGVYSCLQ